MTHEQLAAFFLKKNPGLDYAWILNEKPSGPHPAGKVYWTGFPRGAWAPSSAIVKLVQSVFDRYRDQSFFLLRQKIRTTAPVTDLDRGVLQLAAKRAETVTAAEEFSGTPVSSLDFEEMTDPRAELFESSLEQLALPEPPNHPLSEREIVMRLETLKALVPRGEILHDHNRPVAVLLVDRDGHVLEESVHGGFLNKTLHAELRLVQKYFRRHRSGFPSGSRVYVSLKPCRMCAAMLMKMGENVGEDFRVVFVEKDPGRLAQATLLEKRGRLFQFEGS